MPLLKPYKRPESVLVLVYTKALDVLVLRRRQPNWFWQSVTGSLTWQEQTPQQAAYRELAEETGITALPNSLIDCHSQHQFPIKPAWRHRYASDVCHNTEHVFRLALAQRPTIVLNPAEHTDYCWLPYHQAIASVSSYTNRDAIIKFIAPDLSKDSSHESSF